MTKKDQKLSTRTKYIFLALAFLAAFLERTVFDLGPNVELVTTVMLLAGFYFGKRESFWLVFAIMVLTDLVIGNSKILIFTWSGFLIPALLVTPAIKYFANKRIFKVLSLTTTGVFANIFFYLWTNFGVWELSTMYSKNLTGLINCYINGLPFLKYQLLSTLIFVPLGFLITEQVFTFAKNVSLRKKVLVSPI